jgi:hypothetical protein
MLVAEAAKVPVTKGLKELFEGDTGAKSKNVGLSGIVPPVPPIADLHPEDEIITNVQKLKTSKGRRKVFVRNHMHLVCRNSNRARRKNHKILILLTDN